MLGLANRATLLGFFLIVAFGILSNEAAVDGVVDPNDDSQTSVGELVSLFSKWTPKRLSLITELPTPGSNIQVPLAKHNNEKAQAQASGQQEAANDAQEAFRQEIQAKKRAVIEKLVQEKHLSDQTAEDRQDKEQSAKEEPQQDVEEAPKEKQSEVKPPKREASMASNTPKPKEEEEEGKKKRLTTDERIQRARDNRKALEEKRLEHLEASQARSRERHEKARIKIAAKKVGKAPTIENSPKKENSVLQA